MLNKSQFGQDKHVINIFNNKKLTDFDLSLK